MGIVGAGTRRINIDRSKSSRCILEFCASRTTPCATIVRSIVVFSYKTMAGAFVQLIGRQAFDPLFSNLTSTAFPYISRLDSSRVRLPLEITHITTRARETGFSAQPAKILGFPSELPGGTFWSNGPYSSPGVV